MSLNKNLLAISILSMSLNANAALISYTGDGGVGLVYSSVSDVTWTQDANLLATLETTLGYSTAINAIIAASPVINDTPNFYDIPANSGQHSVTVSDFSAGGYASWFGAKAFVGYLNSINYGGSSQWRLPTSNQIFAYNGTAGNELGQLIYSELGGTPGNNIPNTATFNNEQAYAYWSGTEYAPTPSSAWFWYTFTGEQSINYKGFQGFAWAVSPGQVSAVPLPATSWFMLTGLLGFLGLKRFKKQSLGR